MQESKGNKIPTYLLRKATGFYISHNCFLLFALFIPFHMWRWRDNHDWFPLQMKNLNIINWYQKYKLAFYIITILVTLLLTIFIRLKGERFDAEFQGDAINALWLSWKMESKVVNFDKLFLHWFSSKICEILHKAV